MVMRKARSIWTLDEAAAHFKCCTKTVQKMAQQRGLPYFMMGRLWRFQRADVLAWQQAQRQNAKEVA